MKINSVAIAGMGHIGQAYGKLFWKREFSQIAIAEPNEIIFDGATIVDDYRDLPDADAVIIALPTEMHLEAVRHLAGKYPAVLIEKPLGLTADESQETLDTLVASDTQAMCGLTGLYHPEFSAMYDNLSKIGALVSVHEELHEANRGLSRMLVKKDRGVLTNNGIHTLHRFYKIASMFWPDIALIPQSIRLGYDSFQLPGEDSARGRLQLGSIPFTFNMSFRNDGECDNGKPIDYKVVVEGTESTITVVGWERCSITVDGETEHLYAHPNGPLRGDHYDRLSIGLDRQIGEFLEFAASEQKMHFTMHEAIAAHKLVEQCYGQ